MAILFANRWQLMDFSIGIRQQRLDSVYIFNASLETLFQTAAEITNKTKKCWYPQCTSESTDDIRVPSAYICMDMCYSKFSFYMMISEVCSQ